MPAQLEPPAGREAAGGVAMPSSTARLVHSAALLAAGVALGLMIARLPAATRH